MTREAKKTTVLNQFLKDSPIYGHIEYKQTRTNRFLLSHFEDHQVSSLLAAYKNGLTWKLSDMDPRKKPCDVIRTRPWEDSWICIIYPKCATFIHIRVFTVLIGDFYVRNEKSLSEEQAKISATYIVNF